jgi:hypothetical protein
MDALMAVLWLVAALVGAGADADPACLVLGGLDATRTQAFVTGDEGRLREVYADAPAARADVDLLRSYRERGLRLEGMRMVRESCRVSYRSTRRLTLEVVDRLGPTAVRMPDGRRRDLPRDRPTRHIVVLEQQADGWRIGAVASGESRDER